MMTLGNRYEKFGRTNRTSLESAMVILYPKDSARPFVMSSPRSCLSA